MMDLRVDCSGGSSGGVKLHALAAGCTMSMSANRLSYFYSFKGPSKTCECLGLAPVSPLSQAILITHSLLGLWTALHHVHCPKLVDWHVVIRLVQLSSTCLYIWRQVLLVAAEEKVEEGDAMQATLHAPLLPCHFTTQWPT